MKRTIARGVVALAASGVVMSFGVGTALADDCVNLSRDTDSTQAVHGGKVLSTGMGDFVTKGHWVYLGDVWLFITPGTQSLLGGAVDTSGLPGAEGNFTDGKGDGLLEVSGAASGDRRCAVMDNGHGLAGECGQE